VLGIILMEIRSELRSQSTTDGGRPHHATVLEVNRSDGYGYCTWRENPAGTAARLRVHEFPTAALAMLALRRSARSGAGPNLYFVTPLGAMLQQNRTCTATSLGSIRPPPPGHEHLEPPRPPLFARPDVEGHTLTMRNSYFGDSTETGAPTRPTAAAEGGRSPRPARSRTSCSRRDAGGVATCGGRARTRRRLRACYDVATGVASELRSDANYSRSPACDGLAESALADGRVPGPGGTTTGSGAERLCGGTWATRTSPRSEGRSDGSLDPCP